MRRIPLPIDDVLHEMVENLSSAGIVVLKAPPGAGKTTRVPPALLDAGLAVLEDGKPAKIIVLQPRRVAARAAAYRISEERCSDVGEETGYQVRHERRLTARTRIVVCTEGLFLRRLQEDPLLEDVAAVVFDEFHERSIDSDLALAMVRQIRQEVRPDLRVVVMSATLDPGPISEYLGNCPVVESAGRSYPVAVHYLQFPGSSKLDQLVADGVQQSLPKTDGHILVFLPGIAEIRRAEMALASSVPSEMALMLLHGDMPLEEQQQVLRPSAARKIILSTNVAETSLTIDGVTAVVDSGLARVNRLDPLLGLNKLEISRISKASADQRAGRAGRTSEGICFRLWTEKENQMLREFEVPEIKRVELSECLLQLIAWGESNPKSFPWFEPPPAAAVQKALELLHILHALDKGALTEMGRAMARLPLQPRLARLLLEGARLNCVESAAACAALLSERDVFRRTGPRVMTQHHSDSDVADRVWALSEFERTGNRDSIIGELLPGVAKQVLRTKNQLIGLLDRLPPVTARNAATINKVTADESLERSLLAAFPDRVCKLREPGSKRALMVGGRGVRLSDESAVAGADLFLAVELLESGQSETLVRQASLVEQSWLPESELSESIDVVFDTTRQKVMALKRTRFCDLVLGEMPTAIPANVDTASILAQSVLERFAPESLADEECINYVARINFLRLHMPELQLPEFNQECWRQIIEVACIGCASVSELQAQSLVMAIKQRLTSEQQAVIEREAPARILIPSGRAVKMDYQQGQLPVLAARIQELFGMRETPRIAGGRVSVLLHLLAPNYRVQQITPDLSSFWKNTYADVKKELKRRYPKHSWPEDPLAATPDSIQKRTQK